MVGPSKILTVSYGTFSCTLEGFDDPFSTMRGIAEYFRDLAADDRYFGAEPPTPDAEMLHRIAQQDINRRVEARVENNGIVLRQMDDQSDTEVAAPAPAAEPVAADPQPLRKVKAEPEVQTYDFTDALPARGESVAAKLARIRAAVALREDDAGETYRDDSHVADAIPAAALADAFVDDAEELEEDTVTEVVEEDVVAEVAEEEALVEKDEVAEVVEEDEVAEVVEEEALVEEDEVAEVAEEEEVAAEAEAEPYVPAAFVEEAEVEVEIETFSEAEVEVAREVETFEDEEFEVEIESISMAFQQDEQEAVTETPSEEIAESDLEEEYEAEEVVALATDEEDEQHDPDLASDSTVDEPEQETASNDTMMRVLSQMTGEDESDEDELSDPEADDAPDESAIARVVKMRRVDLEDEVEEEFVSADHVSADQEHAETEEEFEEEFEADAVAEEPTTSFSEPDSNLSDEDEADLMATLEQVRRDSEADIRADKEGRAVLEREDLEDGGNGVQRILEVTNTELEETEGTRRRSAIQHLKAAVLATRADKKLVTEKAEEEDAKQLDQYREDLARVVRPRRPSDGMKPTERRQAPLVLVSEQRVDVAELPAIDLTGEAIRPRRVSAPADGESDDRSGDESEAGTATSENIFADSNSFAEFIEQMGASELPDVLEAAAAYASYVEGRPHFSRPQIMRAVAAIGSDDEFNREDTLRSFGQLLRHGKIRKLSRGQFTVARSTRFNPSARAAGE